MSHWAAAAKATIERVVAENPGKNDEELLELIDAAYPFGMREHWPYKVWLTERRAWRRSRIVPGSDLERVCTTCGADMGRPCLELSDKPRIERAEVPTHESRKLQPAGNGPLFGEA